MLQFPAKTLRNRLQELSELPGLDEVTAKSLILRRPELLRLSMRTVAANISALAALLGVVPAVIPHIVRFHPRLLFLSTLRSNIETTSGLLAIAQARFIAAALRQPQLLFQKPASVLARVERIRPCPPSATPPDPLPGHVDRECAPCRTPVAHPLCRVPLDCAEGPFPALQEARKPQAQPTLYPADRTGARAD